MPIEPFSRDAILYGVLDRVSDFVSENGYEPQPRLIIEYVLEEVEDRLPVIAMAHTYGEVKREMGIGLERGLERTE